MNKNWIIAAIAFVLVVSIVYISCDTLVLTPEKFKWELEALNKENDSLELAIGLKEAEVIELNKKDKELVEALQDEKSKVKIVKVIVEKKVEVVKRYDNLEIAKFYAERYPEEAQVEDTLIPINRPTLVIAAEELIRYDGLQEEVVVKDNIISMQDDRITTKDSIIVIQSKMHKDLSKVVINKDIEIEKWNTQYTNLSKEYKKQRLRNKLTKVGSLVIVGGLTYLLLAK